MTNELSPAENIVTSDRHSGSVVRGAELLLAARALAIMSVALTESAREKAAASMSGLATSDPAIPSHAEQAPDAHPVPEVGIQH